ncbi:MAG: hypothetical protein V3G42_06010 [Oscillospiraceae bacterium]
MSGITYDERCKKCGRMYHCGAGATYPFDENGICTSCHKNAQSEPSFEEWSQKFLEERRQKDEAYRKAEERRKKEEEKKFSNRLKKAIKILLGDDAN